MSKNVYVSAIMHYFITWIGRFACFLLFFFFKKIKIWNLVTLYYITFVHPIYNRTSFNNNNVFCFWLPLFLSLSGALKDWKIVLCFDFWSNSFSYFIYEKYLSYWDRIWTVLFLTCMFSGAANESTRNRVIFYTVLEYILLILASGLQAVYIRSLFSKSIGYNRIWWQILQRCRVFFRLCRPGT